MRKLTLLTLIVGLLISCGQNNNSNNDKDLKQIDSEKKDTINQPVKNDKIEKTEIKSNLIESNLQGEELFKSILDTITIENLTTDLLINSNWIFAPFDNCLSTLTFKSDGDGVSYNCELEFDFEIKYKIDNNYLLIEEYDIPHVDNPEQKKIKTRDDKYIFDGQSLIMIGSTMYNIGGKSWTPQIKVVIKYDKK